MDLWHPDRKKKSAERKKKELAWMDDRMQTQTLPQKETLTRTDEADLNTVLDSIYFHDKEKQKLHNQPQLPEHPSVVANFATQTIESTVNVHAAHAYVSQEAQGPQTHHTSQTPDEAQILHTTHSGLTGTHMHLDPDHLDASASVTSVASVECVASLPIGIASAEEMVKIATGSGCSDVPVDRLMSIFLKHCDTSDTSDILETYQTNRNSISNFSRAVPLVPFVSVICIKSKQTRTTHFEELLNKMRVGPHQVPDECKAWFVNIFDKFYDHMERIERISNIVIDAMELKESAEQPQLVWPGMEVTDQDCIITLLHAFLSESEQIVANVGLAQYKKLIIDHLTGSLLDFIHFLKDTYNGSLVDWLQHISGRATPSQSSVVVALHSSDGCNQLQHIQHMQHTEYTQNANNTKYEKEKLLTILTKKWKQWMARKCEQEQELRYFQILHKQMESNYDAFQPVASRWINVMTRIFDNMNQKNQINGMSGIYDAHEYGINADYGYNNGNGYLHAGNEGYNGSNASDASDAYIGNGGDGMFAHAQQHVHAAMTNDLNINGAWTDTMEPLESMECKTNDKKWYCLCESDTLGEKKWSYVAYDEHNQRILTKHYRLWNAQTTLEGAQEKKRVELYVNGAKYEIYFQDSGHIDAAQRSVNGMYRQVVFDKPDKNNFVRGFVANSW